MYGRKKTTRMMKKRWARYALSEGFAECEYPKDSNYHTISRITMDRRNLGCGCQITFKQYKYWEEEERQQCKVYNYASQARHGPG
jgi:hypothetical protein